MKVIYDEAGTINKGSLKELEERKIKQTVIDGNYFYWIKRSH